MSIFLNLYVLVCACCSIIKRKEFFMYINITGSPNNKDVYIYQSYRKDNGKTSSRIYKKLGKFNDLLERFHGDEQKLLIWAKEQAKIETKLYNQQKGTISVEFSQATCIPKNELRSFSAGYLFLQSICSQHRFDKICRSIKKRHKFKYDLHAIFTDLIYARILSPSSKLSSYDFCKTLLEPPKYNLSDVYRALSVIAEESDCIQSELYKNSNFVHPRNKKILYYDCTNYYFEIEEDDDLRRYGKSKEHRPNPIVTMGLFMDADGIPLAFDIFPGNKNEQTTLKPLESKILQDFDCSEFIFCSDAGLGSANNRRFNTLGNRAYIITHSLKKMKKEDRDIALNPEQFRKLGSDRFIDLRTLDEKEEDVFNSIYYKEIPVVTGNMDENLIITYSPKYKAYQRKIRSRQIERAKKIIETPGRKHKGKNQNDPMRFVKKTSVTPDGEIAEKKVYDIDLEQIKKEEMYDGFYAVITNLEGDIRKIININKQRWEIEKNFRIMKTDFEARPVYVRREDRIKAHFMTCYISLLLYRLLERKLGNTYTSNQIIETLRSMNMTLLNTASGYIPSYTRTELTDDLHKTFGFRTDYEFITKASMRNIIKQTKAIKKENK